MKKVVIATAIATVALGLTAFGAFAQARKPSQGLLGNQSNSSLLKGKIKPGTPTIVKQPGMAVQPGGGAGLIGQAGGNVISTGGGNALGGGRR